MLFCGWKIDVNGRVNKCPNKYTWNFLTPQTIGKASLSIVIHFHLWFFSNSWFSQGMILLQLRYLCVVLSKLLFLSPLTCVGHCCQYHVYSRLSFPWRTHTLPCLLLNHDVVAIAGLLLTSSSLLVMIVSSRIQLVPDVPSSTWSIVAAI